MCSTASTICCTLLRTRASSRCSQGTTSFRRSAATVFFNGTMAEHMSRLLVTGSSGLIGSEVVDYFCRLGWDVHGVDNDMRAEFFGAAGSTRWNQHRLLGMHANFRHHELDIRDR